jgi:enoyl-CoA hydratase/carnithine racemase
MGVSDRKYHTLLVAEDRGILTLTFNRPERRNAIGPLMVNELLYALEDAQASDDVRAIVLTGAGKAFCAGGDFGQMSGSGVEGEQELPPKGDYHDLLLAMLACDKPLIARINGHALGGGLGIVAACTFAVATDQAKFGTPEIKVGLFPFMIMAVLERVMTRRRLIEMMVFGERMTGQAAVDAGLVNKVVPAEELDAAVAHYTDGVLAASPSTLKLGLRAMRDTIGLDMPKRLEVLSGRLVECLATEDAQEGLMAFFQKRDPVWKGR